jgi:hypothetical protein
MIRRPPYAREVIAAIRAGAGFNVHVHVGATAWRRAAAWGPGHRVVVPLDLDHSASDYNFGFLRGLAVTVNAVDADLILARRIAVAVVEQGAALAVLLHPALPSHSELLYGGPNG